VTAFRVFGRLLAATAILFVLIKIADWSRGTSAYSPTAPPASGEPDIARGRYLATAGNCVSCHSRPDGEQFAGGVAFVTPLGTIYSTNITPEPETGIGKWTAADLSRAMHEGVKPDGSRLFPAFPYTSFNLVTDADVAALYAYLRTLAPVKYSPPGNGFVFKQRWSMRIWNWLFFKPHRFEASASQSAQWNRGAYLVEGLGHCGACHTPRNAWMSEIKDNAYSGGVLQETVAAGKVRPWSAANLTSAASGLKSWSVDDLTKYLKSGFGARAGAFGPMNEVLINSTMQMDAEDVRAMAVFLKDLAAKNESGTVSVEEAKAGAQVYTDRCQKCHLASGRGGMFSGPPLAGSAVAQNEEPAALINVILYGADAPKSISMGGWETMKPYADVLSDADVAAVANFVRGNWNNRGRRVTPSEVAKQR
jgi:alcohol dehydrogenase (quinone), cytochrome c subunit